MDFKTASDFLRKEILHNILKEVCVLMKVTKSNEMLLSDN